MKNKSQPRVLVAKYAIDKNIFTSKEVQTAPPVVIINAELSLAERGLKSLKIGSNTQFCVIQEEQKK